MLLVTSVCSKGLVIRQFQLIQDPGCTVCFLEQVGFGLAVEYATNIGLDWIWERIQHLSGFLRSELQKVPGVQIHDKGKTLGGLVTFTKVSQTRLRSILPRASNECNFAA